MDLNAGPSQPLVTPDGRDATLRIHQDARIDRLHLHAGSSLDHVLAPGRHAWLQLARGDATLNGAPLRDGDGVAVSGESLLRVAACGETEALLFDLA